MRQPRDTKLRDRRHTFTHPCTVHCMPNGISPREFRPRPERRRKPLGQPKSMATSNRILAGHGLQSASMRASVERLDVSLKELLLEECKWNALAVIRHALLIIKGYNRAELKALCSSKTIHSASECKSLLIRQLKTLERRFKKTSNAFDGGVEFYHDIAQLSLNLIDLMNAGIAGSPNVVFRKWNPDSEFPVVA